MLGQNILTRFDLEILEFKRLERSSRVHFICSLYTKLPVWLKHNLNINFTRASSIISPRSQQIPFLIESKTNNQGFVNH